MSVHTMNERVRKLAVTVQTQWQNLDSDPFV